MSHSNIIVALDFSSAHAALSLANQLDPARCRLKVGKALFTQSGPAIVKTLVNDGFDVFLDLKYHDIPSTVASACLAAAELGVWMVNVHALGGSAMMTAARRALSDKTKKPLLIAVTLLTSMDNKTCNEIALQGSVVSNVLHLAKMVEKCGLDGVVCSAMEAEALRAQHHHDFKLITPGIRLASCKQDDQHRMMTPINAIRAGSDYLVIGRPITKAKDPMQALISIEHSLMP